jgi:hypothetical protein
LSIVHVLCADINQPCQPKTALIADSLEHGARQDFKEPLAVQSQVPRAEAQAGRWPKASLGGLNPTGGIPVQEAVAYPQRGPFRNRKTAGTIKFASRALVEEQIWPLEVVGELDYILEAVTCPSQDCL